MTTWPHDTPGAGPLREQDLDAAIRASWPPRRAAASCATCRTVKACPAPQACQQPDNSAPQPDCLVRAYNALRRLALRPLLAFLHWQLDCLLDERQRYSALGMVGPTYLRNSSQQEQQLRARLRRLDAS